ncbi:unnamed protein product [Larinioides sclopetarius]|uniref:Uncharacterized protein n=1 Tax=Larinioides sclopetarius TaxID=280406 RepID=A0AAV2BF81_9ARAC
MEAHVKMNETHLMSDLSVKRDETDKSVENVNGMNKKYFVCDVCGCNLYNAKKNALLIDGQITTYCSDFTTIVTVLLASYFVFNIEYNADTALTMEFIQRSGQGKQNLIDWRNAW